MRDKTCNIPEGVFSEVEGGQLCLLHRTRRKYCAYEDIKTNIHNAE
jgi:hypothetical protein